MHNYTKKAAPEGAALMLRVHSYMNGISNQKLDLELVGTALDDSGQCSGRDERDQDSVEFVEGFLFFRVTDFRGASACSVPFFTTRIDVVVDGLHITSDDTSMVRCVSAEIDGAIITEIDFRILFNIDCYVNLSDGYQKRLKGVRRIL